VTELRVRIVTISPVSAASCRESAAFRLPGMPLLGKLLRRFRAGEARSPLSGQDYAGAATIDVTSPAFTDGGAIPQKHAGKGIGDNLSPALQWSGVPADAKQLVLIMDDLDVPMPKPLMHTIAVLEPDVGGLGEGELKPGTTGVRLVKAFGDTYVGPAPIPGHGPHRYRFLVFALDRRIADDVADNKSLLSAMAGHVVARGMLTGTYER
jgi:Raf kinase inhibitor-like YbhB/YbcL family protein